MSQLTQRLAQLSPELRLQLMQRISGKKQGLSFQAIPSVVRDTMSFPLSFAQQRLWFLEQLEPGNATYTIATAVHLEGVVHVALLKQSFMHLLERHESLRTTFSLQQPVQIIHPAMTFTIPLVDLSSLPVDERTAASEAVMKQEAQAPFSLEQGPLLRVLLCRIDERNSILMLTMHHIIADGWSMSVLVQEITTIYSYLLQGLSPLLPELPVQYVDYTVWQRQWLQGEVLQQQLDYWKAQLNGAPALELPTDYPRPAQRSYRGALYSFTLSRDLTRSLRQISQQERATLMMTLLSAFGVLLARYTGMQDMVVGMPVANRIHTEVESLIGFFVNTLALRLDLSGEPDFIHLLQQVRETCLAADAHQDIPFEKLVEELQPQRSLSQAPFFQVMFIPQNQPPASIDLPGLRVHPLRPDRQAAMFDVSLYIFEYEQEIEVCAEYNTDLFEKTTIARMMQHYLRILEGCVCNPHESVWQLPLLTEQERQQTLLTWNESRRSFSFSGCLHDLMDGQVEKRPDAVALIFGEHCLTYSELERRSNQMAHYLQRRGIRPGSLVGILLERSLDMVIGLLGVLKAGGAYVPLDPAYPVERLAYVMQDSALQVLLTQESFLDRSGQQPSLEIVCLEQARSAIAREKGTKPCCKITQLDLAYVIYTSGSTGKPKGVQISHAAVVNFLHSMQEQPGLDVGDILLAVTTISFDIAALEIFLPLTTGARLVLLDRDSVVDGNMLAGQMAKWSPVTMQATPATWRLLLEAGWRGDPDVKILCGGEALTRDLADQLLGKGMRVWNLYGPTETTIWSTRSLVEAGNGPTSIGRPIANTQVYVLDSTLEPVPVGVAGDVYIGGVGVARGYLNRPDLTAERFIPHPFVGTRFTASEPGARLYKTGDRGCHRPDGTLLYLGRSDQQIKLRGFRIELGEIEAVLTEHQAIQVAVVLVREDTPGNKRLVAYLLPKQGCDIEENELRVWLKRHLPDYMIPSAFMQLEAFPLTPNGKIDRRALPAPNTLSVAEEFEAPRNDREQTIAVLWQQLLELQKVGIQQNFFDLGGHSLIAPRLIASINQAFQVALPLRALFAAPTIAELAQMIGDIHEGISPALLAPVDLHAEVVLDPDIEVCQRSHPRVTQPERIFLTGATGILGVYLLSELLLHTHATVYCLLRSSSIDEGKRKLQQQLQAHRLWNADYEDRLIPISGDLSQPLLGLSLQEFTLLAEKVESIYHSGAWVNFTYPYQALKASNVLGTQEVLRLASRAQAPVHFISTLGVFSLSDYAAQTVLKEDAPLEYTAGLDEGYTQSKWVAEKTMMLARSRGIVSSIYRPGIISGHSQTGIGNTTGLVWAALKGCIQLGSAPQIERRINLAPVDYVSKAIVHLSLQQEGLGQTFHFFNPHTIEWNSLVRFAQKFGYPLRHIPFGQWREEMLSELRNPSSKNAFLPFLPVLERFDVDQASIPEAQVFFDDRQTQEGLVGSTIVCPDIDEHLLETYLLYFVQSGFLSALP